MEEQNIQLRIDALDRKLDLILENIELQQRRREEFDDLVSDVSLVTKDAVKHTVMLLDKSQVDLSHSDIPMLLVRLLQNLDTFREMLELLESARDFMKDASPILHQVGLDAIHKMNEFEQKGYFEMLRNLTDPGVIAGFGRAAKALAEVKMDDNIDNRSLFALLKQMNSPEVRKSLSWTLRVIQAINRPA